MTGVTARSVTVTQITGMIFVLCSEFLSGGLRTRQARKAATGGERSRAELGRGRPRDSYIYISVGALVNTGERLCERRREWGGEGERERERALGLLLCHSSRH